MATQMLNSLHINGNLTVTGNVTSHAGAVKSPLSEYTFKAFQPEYRDNWFGVHIEVVNTAYGKTWAGMQHEEVERRVKLWLADNVEHRYVVLQTSVQFKHEDDAVAFYMRFGGGATFTE